MYNFCGFLAIADHICASVLRVIPVGCFSQVCWTVFWHWLPTVSDVRCCHCHIVFRTWWDNPCCLYTYIFVNVWLVAGNLNSIGVYFFRSHRSCMRWNFVSLSQVSQYGSILGSGAEVENFNAGFRQIIPSFLSDVFTIVAGITICSKGQLWERERNVVCG